jgi:peptidoglycan biosynthesis protein MviN/MurJ (putative lipid II flippase)
VSDDQPVGNLRPTPVGAAVGSAVLGLVVGWLLRRLGFSPLVGWGPVLLLFFVAAIMAATAWVTWRQVHVHRRWLEPHKAVNRLVLAKACVLVGALVAGGYAGYALSWLGVDAELAGQRVGRSALAALAGLLLSVMSKGLEFACRVHNDNHRE